MDYKCKRSAVRDLTTTEQKNLIILLVARANMAICPGRITSGRRASKVMGCQTMEKMVGGQNENCRGIKSGKGLKKW